MMHSSPLTPIQNYENQQVFNDAGVGGALAHFRQKLCKFIRQDWF